VTHLIFFILFGAGMYFLGAIVSSGRIRMLLKIKIGVRLISLKHSSKNDPFTSGFVAGMKWAVDQVMDEPVDWARIEEVVNERMGM